MDKVVKKGISKHGASVKKKPKIPEKWETNQKKPDDGSSSRLTRFQSVAQEAELNRWS